MRKASSSIRRSRSRRGNNEKQMPEQSDMFHFPTEKTRSHISNVWPESGKMRSSQTARCTPWIRPHITRLCKNTLRVSSAHLKYRLSRRATRARAPATERLSSGDNLAAVAGPASGRQKRWATISREVRSWSVPTCLPISFMMALNSNS
jgi:hypothetical protein